jgi:hypothetical protein
VIVEVTLSREFLQVIKEGQLQKSSEILGGKKLMWKKKWCVIDRLADGTRRFLYYDKRGVR